MDDDDYVINENELMILDSLDEGQNVEEYMEFMDQQFEPESEGTYMVKMPSATKKIEPEPYTVQKMLENKKSLEDY